MDEGMGADGTQAGSGAVASSGEAASPLGSFLRGTRVLDLSQYIPGPMATQVLADMGADVLKVEPPGGDGMSHLGPRGAAGEPIFYDALNAGKSVYRLNLKDISGRTTLAELARGHDVLVEGFRPGVMERLGLGYGALAAENPGLVYCSISGYGASGIDIGRAGHDGNYLAACGVLHRNAGAMPFDPPVSDVGGGLYAAVAILGALHGRSRTGRGCHIDLALVDAVMPLQTINVADYGARHHVPEPEATYSNGGAAYYRAYATGDGRHVMLGAIEPKFWEAFCRAAEHPDWIRRQGEPLPQADLTADVAAFFAASSLAGLLARFDGVDCCLSPVLDLREALESTALQARGLVRSAPDTGALQALFPAWIDGKAPPLRPALRTVTAPQAEALPSSAGPDRG